MTPLIYIYADESCLGVQFTDRDSPGGAAGLIQFHHAGSWRRRDYWVSEPATTNQRMAIRSATEGLSLISGSRRIVLVSDSQYLVRGIREWLPAWRARGWKRKTGSIANEQLWRALAEAASRHQVDPRWVRGHAGHPQNEYANHLATRAARDQSSSNGLVASGFEAWLEQQREHDRYLEFDESAPPPDEGFDPAPALRS
jgi:ribonuclease HI